MISFAIPHPLTTGSEAVETDILARQKIWTVEGIVQLTLVSSISAMGSKFTFIQVSTTISFSCNINQYLVLCWA
jgi:hypothetical protein